MLRPNIKHTSVFSQSLKSTSFALHFNYVISHICQQSQHIRRNHYQAPIRELCCSRLCLRYVSLSFLQLLHDYKSVLGTKYLTLFIQSYGYISWRQTQKLLISLRRIRMGVTMKSCHRHVPLHMIYVKGDMGAYFLREIDTHAFFTTRQKAIYIQNFIKISGFHFQTIPVYGHELKL